MRLWRCPRASSARAESTVRAFAHLRDFQSDPVNNLGCLAGSHKPANLGGGGSRRASSAPAPPWAGTIDILKLSFITCCFCSE